MRAGDAPSGLRKLRNSVARFEASPHALARLTEANVLCGDLGTFAILLSDPRAQRVTHVVNCAALVSFARKPGGRTTNVATGTAARGQLQEFDIAELGALQPEFERWFGPCDPKRTAYAIRAYCAFASLNVTFDNSRLRDADVDGCVRTSARTSIAQQMETDGR